MEANKNYLDKQTREKQSGPANWRPITIGFAIQRLFRRVLGQRLSNLIYLDPNPRGFVQKDGCLASSLILDTLIKDSTQARLGTSLISTDLRKAFHPVSHFSILRSLRRVHAPPYLSGYIQETLTSSSTVIHVNQESLDPIAINRGVRQGDSLNPILFNIVLDELATFADDVVLLAENDQDLQVLVDTAVEFFKHKGIASSSH